ncbi:protein YgfX [Paraglaciecola sp.]|uniref:protein YgfX n=1 Tax=Paraglaciecola sp. TaxID=1920173 RepID=UPI0030F3FFF4
MLLVTLWGLVLLSVFHWQADIFPYQHFFQVILAIIILLLAYKTVQRTARVQPFVIAFNQQGQVNYLDRETPEQWQLTDKSRLTNWLLWIQLASPIDPRQRHWLLIFKDQVNVQDYRRLCRAILYQQQTKDP